MEEKFQIKFKHNFFCFVKHAFTYNEILGTKYLVNRALKSQNNSNYMLKIKDLKMYPKIVVKILGYSNSAELFYPKNIMQNCTILYSDFSENFNYDLKKINLPLFRTLVTNLILYGIEMTDMKIPFDLLIYTLYAIKDIDKKEENEIKENA